MKNLLVIIFSLLSINVFGQRCEWLNTEGNQRTQYFHDMAVDTDNNIIVCGRSTDSLRIGNFLIPKQTFNGLTNTNNPVLFKYDEFGDLLWVDTTIKFSSLNSYLDFINVFTDANNNIYATAGGRGGITFSNAITINITSSQQSTLLLKYNKNGKLLWVKEILSVVSSPALTVGKSENLYLCGTYMNAITFQNTSATLTSNGARDIYIAKYSKDGVFLNAKSFGGSGNDYSSNIETDDDDNIYVAGTSDSSFNFASKTLHNEGRIIIKFDSALTPINGKKFNLNININSFSRKLIAVDSDGNISFFAKFRDSVNFGNNVWLQDTLFRQFSFTTEACIIYFDSSLTAKWARKSSGINTSSGVRPTSTSIQNEHIYFGGSISGQLKFGSSSVSGNSIFLVGKADTLGNILWAFAGNDTILNYSSVIAIDVGDDGKAVIGGSAHYKVTVFDKQKNTNRFDLFTAKLMDYFIRRGYVSEGPYCAGDSIKIPYTKYGEFNVGNEFVAEISDSAGNFTGGHRELGRVKDTASGIIKGALPLFNVATNNKYRIRVISTNPTVQSFYKKDTLRLLIYSRDTANAGPDRFVCKGEEVRLGTTGGSKWLWSPKNKLVDPADSSNRQPLIKLYDSAEYRIIISDSSGCGEVDTDYVKIYVRPYIKAQIKGESIVCKGYTQNLTTQITGGDSSGYWYIWKPVNANTILGTDSILTIQTSDTSSYLVIVGDSCSDKTDTAYFTINTKADLKVYASADTTVCKGKAAILSATGTGCNPKNYSYTWLKKGDTTVLSRDDTAKLVPLTTTQYLIILRDTNSILSDTATVIVTVDSSFYVSCTKDTTVCKGKNVQLTAKVLSCDTSGMIYTWDNGLGNGKTKTISVKQTTTYTVIGENTFNNLKDTAQVTVTVDSVFNISTIADSTICLGQTIDLSANVFSCDTSNMVYIWDNGLGTGKTKTVSPSQTTTYTVIGENTFNNLKDTAQVTITIRPKLEVRVNQDSIICIGEEAELRATATGGRNSTHQIEWYVNNNLIINNPITTIQPTTTTTYKAILSDGCTVNDDSAEITITVRPKLEINTNQDSTICIGEQAELRATTIGGLETNHTIQWEYNGQQLSNNPILQLSPTQTSTYTAIVSDGCTTPNDSAELTITVRAPLSVNVNTDSTICIGEEAELRAIITGGNPNTYSIQWTANNQQLSTNNILKVTPTANTVYQAKLTDNCTTPSDSTTITINVRPALQLTTTAKDSICSNEILLLTAIPSGGLTTNHQIQWIVDGGLWTSSQNPATDTPQITTKYIAQLSDNCSPTVYDTLEVLVLPIPTANFTATPTFGCPPLKVNLQDLSIANDSTQNTWTIAGAEYQSTKTQTHELLKQGEYNIKLNVKNQLGCSDETTQIRAITVFEKPQADFIIKPNIKEVEETLQLYNLSRGATNSIWLMGDGNQFTTPKDTSYKYHEDDTGNRQVQLIAINNQGCKDTAKQNLLIYNKVHCTIPTAFTPNGDGYNNSFKPVCVGVGNYTLTIYNRWGQVIYQQDNGAWDGNYIEQPVPMGVYMYKLQINAQSQKKKLSYGTVQLIR